MLFLVYQTRVAGERRHGLGTAEEVKMRKKEKVRGKLDEELGEVFLCLTQYIMRNETIIRQILKQTLESSLAVVWGVPFQISSWKRRRSWLNLQFREGRQPVISKRVWPCPLTASLLWLLRHCWVARGSLLRAKAFCHFYDTTAITLFEFVVYIFDSLPDQTKHCNKTLLLLMLE